MKNYVLDTNILLNFPTVMYDLDGEVIIPFTVLEELEHQKHQTEKPNLKYMARVAVREIHAAVKDGYCSIYMPKYIKKEDFDFLSTYTVNDDLILATIVELNKTTGKVHTLVSNDYGMYLKAKGLEVEVIQHEPEVAVDKNFKGFTELAIPQTLLDVWCKKETKTISIDKFPILKDCLPVETSEFITNSFYELISEYGTDTCKTRVITFYDDKTNSLIKVKEREEFNLFQGVIPKNKEQAYLCHMLDHKDIPCVQVKAQAGSGKTFITVAWALGAIADGKHKKMIYIKSLDPVSGKDIGYLPGSKEDKMMPFMSPLFDSIESMTDWSKDRVKAHLGMMEDAGEFEIEAISHIRGRSFKDTILIIDEAENLDVPTLRTVLTRIGENCKIIIISDDAQIDNPKLSAVTNGTALMKDRLVGQPLYGFIELQSSVRSEFAGIINRLMI